jgi:hypothetical protein
VETTTAAPPAVRRFPGASLACTVATTLEPETTEEATDSVDLAAEGWPGWTVTEAVEATATALIVAVRVTVPTRTPVTCAVYVPAPPSTTLPMITVPALPGCTLNATAKPPVLSGLPAALGKWKVLACERLAQRNRGTDHRRPAIGEPALLGTRATPMETAPRGDRRAAGPRGS